MVTVVIGTREVADEAALDAPLESPGHVKVEVEHTEGHPQGCGVAEHGAVAFGDETVQRVDDGPGAQLGVGALCHLPAQALLVSLAAVVEADEVSALGFFLK